MTVLAGCRGYNAASRLDDPVLQGFATYVRSNALTRMGERDRATRLLMVTTESLTERADPTGTDSLTELAGTGAIEGSTELYPLAPLTSTPP